MKFETEIIIKEFHLDTFGHVNNAAYLQIFEESRWEIGTRNGFGLAEVQSSRKAPIILELNLKFRRELKVREKVKITFAIPKLSRRISEVYQEILNEKGEVCTIATFQMGFFDLEKRALIPPPPEWLRAMGVGETSWESTTPS